MLPLRRNQNWLPNIFNDIFDNDWIEKVNTTSPSINVIEKPNEYQVQIAAPGMTKDDFKVSLDEEGNLVVAMEKKAEKEEKKEETHYLRREFSYSQFTQAMVLPEDVDKEKIEAHVENGVLDVTLPKLSPVEVKKQTKQIAIN